MTSAQPLRRDLLLILAFGLLLFMGRLGQRDIWYSPEARVAQVARQMRHEPSWHNLIVPHMGDDVRIKKPPLAYWLVLLASLPFDDVDEFNSRLPNAISAIGLMIVVYLLTLRLFDRGTAIMASCMLATTGLFWIQARQTGIELPMLFLNALGIYCWWLYRMKLSEQAEAIDGKTDTGGRWLLCCYIFMVLSFLEKGPVGPLLVLFIAWLWLLASGEWRRPGWLIRHHLAGIVIFLLLALPWYLAVWIELPDAMKIWLQESAGRAGGSDHAKELIYYLRKIPGDGQPWVLLAFLSPFLFAHIEMKAKKKLLLPVCWAIGCLFFFTLFSSKKSYYMLPIYPALAMLAAAVVMQSQRADTSGRLFSLVRWLMISVGSALSVTGIAGRPIYQHLADAGKLRPVYLDLSEFVIPLCVITLTGGIIIIFFAARRQVLRSAIGLISVTCLAFALYTCTIPERNRHKGTRHLAATLKPLLKQRGSVYIYDIFAPEVMAFHLNHHVERIGSEAELRDLIKNSEQIYILFSEKDFADLPPAVRDSLHPISQEPLPSRCFWTGLR